MHISQEINAAEMEHRRAIAMERMEAMRRRDEEEEAAQILKIAEMHEEEDRKKKQQEREQEELDVLAEMDFEREMADMRSGGRSGNGLNKASSGFGVIRGGGSDEDRGAVVGDINSKSKSTPSNIGGLVGDMPTEDELLAMAMDDWHNDLDL
jgi:hypothetical protein